MTAASSDDNKYQQLQNITLLPRGFLIPKEAESNNWLVRRAVNDLTFQKPQGRYQSKYSKKEPPLRVYVDSQRHMLVPKFWAIGLFRGRGVPIVNANEDGEPLRAEAVYRDDLPLIEDKRRPQQSAHAYVMQQLARTGGAMLIMPVGTGKTNVGLKVALDCGRRILWLTHRRNLMEQVAERVAEFAPGARVGYLYAERNETEDCDIVLATVQSVGQKTYDPQLFRQFGTVVLDEAHHAAAPLFVEALFTVAAPRMLALTANEKRKDGFQDITYHFFSNNRFVVEPTLPAGILLHIVVFRIAKRQHTLEPDLCDADFRRKRERMLARIARENGCDTDRAIELHRQQLEAQPDDISDAGYTLLCSSLARIASFNALIVACIKRALITRDAAQFDDVSLAEMRDTEFVGLHDRDRNSVLVRLRDRDECVPIDSLSDSEEDVARRRRYLVQQERQVLVACFHKAHVDSLGRRLERSGVPAAMIGKYYGDCSPAERKSAMQKRIVLLTYAMAEEGLDEPTPNALVIADPRGEIALQTIGRILRDRMTAELMPLVVHAYHKWCAIDEGLFWARQRQFRVYPNVVRYVDIGKAQQTNRTVMALQGNADSVTETEDLRLSEVGAISSVFSRRQAKPATSKKRKTSTSDERKQARVARRQLHLAHAVASAQSASNENENSEDSVDAGQADS